MGRLSKDAWIEVISRYQDGELAGSLAKEFGCSGVAINAMLNRKGIKKHTSSYVYRTAAGRHINEKAFDKITPDSAYWVGFLMADGTVTTGNTVAIALSEKDKEHLDKFREFVGSNNKIIFGIKSNHSEEIKSCRFSFRSSRICKALAQYGVIENKTHTARVSNALARNSDFWRGVIDGDGWIANYYKKSYFNKNPKIYAWSKPHNIARLSLVGSKQLLDQFYEFVMAVSPMANISVRKHKSIFRVELSGKTAESIVKMLYGDASTALLRKANAAKNILKFSTAGEAGLEARGAGQNLLGHVSSTCDETRTDAGKFTEAVRLERAA